MFPPSGKEALLIALRHAGGSENTLLAYTLLEA